MFQLPLLFLGCALARYLWTITCTVSGVTSRFSIIAATLFHNAPAENQTPLPILTHVFIKYFAHSGTTSAHSLQSRDTPGWCPPAKNLSRSTTHLGLGGPSVLDSPSCLPRQTHVTSLEYSVPPETAT
ncbi:hypothetical protein BDM02DRAFT_3119771 [Thelephora ganbajun]|uniref:Uncharacterized protein n=1 Tax=Thelephora ganbajun TaxID=370292 RepID=A0ACB6Z861_THEGA|nr:hypothetical protein BDM02DRAFT_3119771 [Thelephora ganbajun]